MRELFIECRLNFDVEDRIKILKMLNEKNNFNKIVDNKLYLIFENKNKIDPIRKINKNIHHRKFSLKEEVLNNEKEFIPKIKSIKIDSQHQQMKCQNHMVILMNLYLFSKLVTCK